MRSASGADVFAPGTPGVVDDPGPRVECDVAIVGSGIGGATLAWALRDSGARVLVVERGDFVAHEWQNWSPREVHERARYKNAEPLLDADGRAFVPGSYSYVGGNSKFYGAALLRFREQDFGELEHEDGVSPAWPLSYADLEPHYCVAERLYHVHGGAGDPTDPWRSQAFPHPPLEHEPPVAAIAEQLRSRGLSPAPLPMAVDRRPGGACVLCGTCDAYPCLVDAKGDADVSALRPSLQTGSVRVLTRADVRNLSLSGDGGSVAALRVLRDGRELTVHAGRFVVAAGAIGTAALLLRSRDASRPDGVANGSGLVGRNYMAHNTSFVVGVRPAPRAREAVFQKTILLNDWYFAGADTSQPLGSIQPLGKLYGSTVKPARRWIPRPLLDAAMRRSFDWYAQSEDLPRPENRVVVDGGGRVRLELRTPTNQRAHRELVRRTKELLRATGYPLTFSQQLGIEGTAHQCGTARMGDDGATSVVDRDCRAHDLSNLWIVDGSVFPSSAACNPALTIAALALRVADRAGLTA